MHAHVSTIFSNSPLSFILLLDNVHTLTSNAHSCLVLRVVLFPPLPVSAVLPAPCQYFIVYILAIVSSTAALHEKLALVAPPVVPLSKQILC